MKHQLELLLCCHRKMHTGWGGCCSSVEYPFKAFLSQLWKTSIVLNLMAKKVMIHHEGVPILSSPRMLYYMHTCDSSSQNVGSFGGLFLVKCIAVPSLLLNNKGGPFLPHHINSAPFNSHTQQKRTVAMRLGSPEVRLIASAILKNRKMATKKIQLLKVVEEHFARWGHFFGIKASPFLIALNTLSKRLFTPSSWIFLHIKIKLKYQAKR